MPGRVVKAQDLSSCDALMRKGRKVLKMLKRFVANTWLEMPENMSTRGKVLRCVFCGLRLLDEDTAQKKARLKPRQSAAVEQLQVTHETLNQKRDVNFSSHLSVMVFIGCAGFKVFQHSQDSTQVQDAAHPKCGIGAKWNLARETWIIVLLWFISQILVRLAMERPNHSKVFHKPNADFGQLFILEIFAWAVFFVGDVFVDLILMRSEGVHITIDLILAFLLNIWSHINLLLIVAPTVVFSVAPVRHKVAEAFFDIAFLLEGLHLVGNVIEDGACVSDELTALFKLTGGEGPAIILKSLRHFYHTHRFCVVIAVFLRTHISDNNLPDIMLIKEVFSERGSSWIPYRRLLKCVAAAILAMACPVLVIEMDKGFGTEFQKDKLEFAVGYCQTTYHIIFDLAMWVHVVRCYVMHQSRRRQTTWEAQTICIAGVAGIAYYAGSVESFDRNLQSSAAFLDFSVFVASSLLAADTFAHRLRMSGAPRFTALPLLYSVSCLVDWVVAENKHGLHQAAAEDHGGADHGGAAGDHGTGHASENQELMKHIGRFASVEAMLMQTIGWIVHMMEFYETHAHAEHHDHHGQGHGVADTGLPGTGRVDRKSLLAHRQQTALRMQKWRAAANAARAANMTKLGQNPLGAIAETDGSAAEGSGERVECSERLLEWKAKALMKQAMYDMEDREDSAEEEEEEDLEDEEAEAAESRAYRRDRREEEGGARGQLELTETVRHDRGE